METMSKLFINDPREKQHWPEDVISSWWLTGVMTYGFQLMLCSKNKPVCHTLMLIWSGKTTRWWISTRVPTLHSIIYGDDALGHNRHYCLLAITFTSLSNYRAVRNTPEHLIADLRHLANRFILFKEGGCWLAWSLLARLTAMYDLFPQSCKQHTMSSMISQAWSDKTQVTICD